MFWKRGCSFGAAAFSFVLLPGLGGSDGRSEADLAVPPFDAVARLNVPGIARCTATMVAPNFAVTAAHCLTKPGLGHFVGAGSVHLLLGYKGGHWTRHIVPDLVLLPPGADPENRGASPADYAVLHFAPPVRAFVPPGAAVPGGAAMLAGFNQDRVERLGVDRDCRVAAAGPLLRHDCAGTRGTSGGPLLQADGAGGWRLVGVQVAGGAGRGGWAVPAVRILALMPTN